MIYRTLSPTGDYTFGQGQFLRNSPAAVGQAVLTRLALQFGEWFLDTTDGTPWNTQVLGPRTRGTRDAVVRSRVLGTPNVQGIASYQSNYANTTRQFDVINVTITTAYGAATVPVQLPSFVSN